MNYRFTNFFCRRCGQARRFTRRDYDRQRHVIATILTLGLWGPVWYMAHRRDVVRPWHCCICRTSQQPMDEPPEVRTNREKLGDKVNVPIQPRRSSWS